VAFEEEIVLDRPGPTPGRKHDKMIGRPVSMHAMRGISAHSNGFQTCRALHVLQILLGSSIAPAASASSRPTPSQTPPPLPHGLPRSSSPDAAGRPASGLSARAGRPADRGGREPSRIDKAFSGTRRCRPMG
jgi:anaerobic selenocysteine-containing dehydrogenase